jgi:hypothetical protein
MQSESSLRSESLSDFRPWTEWLLEGRGGAVLSSPGAVQWFCRKHRQRLVDSGQLILRSGPGGHYVGPRFSQVVLEILREESAANLRHRG